jgi:peptidoglycan/LPS O-acetylase OafA/YrhL
MEVTTTKSVREQAGILRKVMPELDAVRGVAILLVLLVHGFASRYGIRLRGVPGVFLRFTSGGWLGVNLFFVLSGFLITGILLDSKSRTLYYRNFYIRRALRILPAYYALLLLLVLTKASSIQFAALSLIYLANLTPLFGVAISYGPLWSLAVEEHFYLLWPLLVKRTKMWGLTVTTVALIIACPLLRAQFFLMHGNLLYINSYTWLVVDGLATGSLIAIQLRSRFGSRKITGLIGGCTIIICIAVIYAGKGYGILTRTRLLGAMFQVTVWNLFFAGVLLLLLLTFSGKLAHVQKVPGLAYLGSISYGLYLIHLQIFRWYDQVLADVRPRMAPENATFQVMWIRFAVVVTISIAIASLSRKYFEERFLSMKDRLAPSADHVRPDQIPAECQSAGTTKELWIK